MIKLSKYEFRKNLGMLVIMFVIIGVMEGYFLGSIIAKSRTNTVIAAAILMLGTLFSYFFVFLYGVVSYSKELASKTSYLIFMTPVSSMRIILSKLLTTLAVGVILCVLLGLLGVLDVNLMFETYPSFGNFQEFLETILDTVGYNLGNILLSIGLFVFDFLVEFFSIVSLAYLSITLSSTLFQNKKYKGIISFLLFVLLSLIVVKVGDLLPTLGMKAETFASMVFNTLPNLLWILLVMIVCVVTSAKLLDKKVSL